MAEKIVVALGGNATAVRQEQNRPPKLQLSSCKRNL